MTFAARRFASPSRVRGTSRTTLLLRSSIGLGLASTALTAGLRGTSAPLPVEPAPAVALPSAVAPVIEAPVVEAPVVEAPVVEAPVVEAPERPVTQHVSRTRPRTAQPQPKPKPQPQPQPQIEVAAATHGNSAEVPPEEPKTRSYREFPRAATPTWTRDIRLADVQHWTRHGRHAAQVLLTGAPSGCP